MNIKLTGKPIGATFATISAAQEQGAFQNAYIKANVKDAWLHWTKN